MLESFLGVDNNWVNPLVRYLFFFKLEFHWFALIAWCNWYFTHVEALRNLLKLLWFLALRIHFSMPVYHRIIINWTWCVRCWPTKIEISIFYHERLILQLADFHVFVFDQNNSWLNTSTLCHFGKRKLIFIFCIQQKYYLLGFFVVCNVLALIFANRNPIHFSYRTTVIYFWEKCV